jgi:hypothetical protein
VIGRERLRLILREAGVSFQRTRTWKESKDPDKDAKLDRIEEVTSWFPDIRILRAGRSGPPPPARSLPRLTPANTHDPLHKTPHARPIAATSTSRP